VVLTLIALRFRVLRPCPPLLLYFFLVLLLLSFLPPPLARLWRLAACPEGGL